MDQLVEMSQDTSLLKRLQNLDLETTKQTTLKPPLNPFLRRRRSKSLSSINFGSTCDCTKKTHGIRHTTSFKKTRKLLREPILKFIKCDQTNCKKSHKYNRKKEKLFGQCARHKDYDFKSIIDACERLNLTNSTSSIRNSEKYKSASFQCARSSSIKLNTSQTRQDSTNNLNSSCAHQARMNIAPPCDVTIDELASYFETFVHIPKKMSSMAEMMYI